jgi:Tol biopolymer transport system component/DNA-binding winged helix-turn-helix (wHTH) protein
MASSRQSYEFGSFRLDPAARVLTRDGIAVNLDSRLFDLLVVLIQQSAIQNGRVVPKQELMTLLWPNNVVEESNLSQNVFWLRKALGQQGAENRYIVTVPGQGYAFVVEARECSNGDERVKRPGSRLRWPHTRLALVCAMAAVPVLCAFLFLRDHGRGASKLVTRRIVQGTEVAFPGSVSRDGRWLAYTASNVSGGRPLVIRDIATGRTRVLKADPGSNEDLKFARFSPDGSHIAYVHDRSPARSIQLYVIPVDGSGAARAIHESEDVDVIGPVDWSPDGKTLAAVLHRRGETTSQIVVLPTKGGARRVLKTLNGAATGPWRIPAPCFSPDGRFIAYSYPPEGHDGPADIFIQPVNGGGDYSIVSHPANDRIIAWSEDGRLIFASDRRGARDLWALPVNRAKATGPPATLQRDIGNAFPLGLTRDGTFFCQRDHSSRDVYLVKLHPVTGSVIGGPSPVDQHRTGRNQFPDWSADGKSLAYVTERGVKIHSMVTGEEREILADLPKPLGALRWSPDGASLLIAGTKPGRQTVLYRMDLPSGRLSLAVDRDLGEDSALNPNWSADGKTLIYKANNLAPAPLLPRKLFQWNPLTRKEKIFFGQFQFGTWALSPSGRQVAFARFGPDDLLLLVPAGGGAPQVVFRAPPGSSIPKLSTLAWTKDELSLLTPIVRKQSGETAVWQIPLLGGQPRVLFSMDRISTLRVSPDGVWLALEAWEYEQEIWAMENLMSQAAKPR